MGSAVYITRTRNGAEREAFCAHRAHHFELSLRMASLIDTFATAAGNAVVRYSVTKYRIFQYDRRLYRNSGYNQVRTWKMKSMSSFFLLRILAAKHNALTT